jgi:hypothetical protein
VEARLRPPDLRQAEWLQNAITGLDRTARVQDVDAPNFWGVGRQAAPPSAASAPAAPVDHSSMDSKLNARNWEVGDVRNVQRTIGKAVTGDLVDWDSYELFEGPDGEWNNAKGIQAKFPNWTPQDNGRDRQYLGPSPAVPATFAQPKANATPAQTGALGRMATGRGRFDVAQRVFGNAPDPKLTWTTDEGRKVKGNQAAFRQQLLRKSLANEQDVAVRNNDSARAILAYETNKSGRRSPNLDRLQAQMNMLRQFGIQA